MSAEGDLKLANKIRFGEDSGTFTFIAEEVQGDIVVASTTFAGIPVTASTTATFNIPETADIASTTLAMDVDGNGTIDVQITPGDGVTDSELIAILKGIVKSLNLPDNKEKKLLKAIEKLEKELAKEHKSQKREKKKTDKAFENLIKQIEKIGKKKLLTAEEASELISIVEEVRDSVVE